MSHFLPGQEPKTQLVKLIQNIYDIKSEKCPSFALLSYCGDIDKMGLYMPDSLKNFGFLGCDHLKNNIVVHKARGEPYYH